MTDTGLIFVWLFCAVMSLVIAGLAGRGIEYAAWGLVGPIGWIIAAIHGAEDRAAARSGSAAVAALQTAAEPSDLVAHPCPNCGVARSHPKRTEGMRMPCAECGINTMFGPEAG